MTIGADGDIFKDKKTYLVDALRFALSISPYSIPCNQNLGIEMKRISDFEDITSYEVRKIIRYLDSSGQLECLSCTLNQDKVNIIVRFTDEDEKYYRLTFS